MGCAVAGSCSSAILTRCGRPRRLREALLVVGEFGGGGELAVEQEVGDFFELAVGGEVEDVVAAVVEVVAVAADGAEGGVAGGDAGEGYGFLGLEGGGFGGMLSLVAGALSAYSGAEALQSVETRADAEVALECGCREAKFRSCLWRRVRRAFLRRRGSRG